MAKRPWALPQEVREYTDRKSVKERTDTKLAIDISRAEQHVINYTHNRFEEKYPVIPDSVRTAVILIAEAYAANAASFGSGSIKSETFDDYSYTVSDTANDTAYSLGNLDLGALLDEFVCDAQKAPINMRMRKL